jgi:hypothetical protein
MIDNSLWLTFLPEEYEGTDEDDCHDSGNDEFAVLFHIFLFSMFQFL